MTPLTEITVAVNGKPVALRYPASPVDDYIVQSIFTDDEYPALPYLRVATNAVLDIGANCGCASLLFASRYPDASIFAFEPGRAAFELLTKNTAPCPRIRTFNYGLYDRDGTMNMLQGRLSSGTNSLGISPHNITQFEEIVVRRPSSVVRELGIDRIAILKIDTEGAEVAILRDLGSVLDCVEAIFLEYHSENDRLEIDRLLAGRFMLVHGKIHSAHRGVFAYVAKDVVRSRTDLDDMAIPPPNDAAPGRVEN